MWIEVKLDHVIASDEWIELFGNARSTTLEASRDHLPILLRLNVVDVRRMRRRAKFENLWLRESLCREVVIQSWNNSKGLDLLTRVERCGKAMWNWGKRFTRDFQKRIKFWKKRMEMNRGRRDREWLNNFAESQR